jgi:hypothetical protein
VTGDIALGSEIADELVYFGFHVAAFTVIVFKMILSDSPRS